MKTLFNTTYMRIAKRVVMIVAMILVVGNVLGDNISYTFTSKSWAATSGGSAANWTSGLDGNLYSSGIQVTEGTTGANGTSPRSFSNISNIRVYYHQNKNDGVGTIKVKVGTGAEKSYSVSKPSSGTGSTQKNHDFSFSPTETGTVTITVNCTSNSIYIESVTITYTPVACTAAPTVTAGSYSNLRSTTATISCASGLSTLGTGDCGGVSSYGFVVGPSANPELSAEGTTTYEKGTTYTTTGTAFSHNLTGLTPNTTYYVRPYATNGFGTGYGTQTSFTTLQRYTIDYNNNGGMGSVASAYKDHGIDFTLSNGSTMSKTGYRLTNWLLGSASGEEHSLSGTYTGNGNVTFYAQWTPNSYSVVFSANTGSGSMTDQAFTYDEAQALSECTLTPPLHKYFTGWNTKANGSGTPYSDGQSVSNLVTTNDGSITLYAQWADHTYTNYRTRCCTDPATALSITSADGVALDKTLSLSSAGGNGMTVSWSVVDGTGSASIEGTTLTPISAGTVTVRAHQDINTSTNKCEQNDEMVVTIVDETVNVTSVEVSPTSKVIIPGESFSITPTVSPADATDKSVGWSSSDDSKASVNGLGIVTGAAAGTATITCTTTDGSKTATTAVTVYGVTMQARDEDGNAIAVGGPGTPNREGIAISPDDDAANYVFKEWQISGAELGDDEDVKENTITNPTGAVTVTAVYYKPIIVTWKIGLDDAPAGSQTTEVAYGGKISALPTAPAEAPSCTETFVGWSAAAIGVDPVNGDDVADLKLFKSAGSPNVEALTEDVTYRAVFASNKNGGTRTLSSEEIKEDGAGGTGYGSYAITDSEESTWNAYAIKNQHSNATSDVHFLQIKAYDSPTAYYVQVPTMPATIKSITMTVSGTSQARDGGNNSATLYFSSSNNNTTAAAGVALGTAVSGTGGSSITLDCETLGLTTGYITASAAIRIWDFSVDYGEYEDYVARCCTQPGTASGLSQTGAATTNSLTVGWIAAANASQYRVTLYSDAECTSPASATVNPIVVDAPTVSATFAGLEESTEYYFKVQTIGDDLVYCAEGPVSDASGAVRTKSSKTLSSIAITTAPRAAYLEGETFSTAGMVVTAYYSDETSEPVTPLCTFSPTTALTPSNSNITISYEDKEATQTINVYTLTVNKATVSGEAIDALGVSAEGTGMTLSASEGSTNYAFKQWEFVGGNKGLSFADASDMNTTLSGTPTGNVTVKAVFYAPVSVAWVVNNEAYTTGDPTEVAKHGSAVSSLPTEPSGSTIGDCANYFAGWSSTNIGFVPVNGEDIEALGLFDDAEDAPALDGDVTYYAVFAYKQNLESESDTLASWSRSSNTNTVTSGFAFNASGESGSNYYQDGSGDGEKRYVQFKKSDTSTPLIPENELRIPTKVTLYASIGGGTTKDPLTNNVYAVWLDANGDELGVPQELTDKVTAAGGSTFQVDMPFGNVNSAYGVRIYHTKETCYNVRYYNATLKYTYTPVSVTNYVTECCDNLLTLGASTISNGTITYAEQALSPIPSCGGTNTVNATVTPTAGYKVTALSFGSGYSSIEPAISLPLESAQTYTLTYPKDANMTVAATATTTPILVTGLSLTATKLDNEDDTISTETGSNVVLNLYPTEGKTSSPADVFGHKLSITAGEVLPANALNKGYTWSATVNGVAQEFDGNALTTSVIEFNKSTGKLVAKAAGTAEIIITANDDSGTYAKVTVNVVPVALSNIQVAKSVTELYVGESEEIAVTYDPVNVTTKGYTTGSYSYVTIGLANNKITLTGKSVTKIQVETVTLTASSDPSKTATIEVTVKPLPRVHFVDIIHGVNFSDVVATTPEGVFTKDQATPTNDDIVEDGEACDKTHQHLVGWIDSEWTPLVEYMSGESDTAPDKAAIEAATGYFYTAGASIDTQDRDGKTYFAVWSTIE